MQIKAKTPEEFQAEVERTFCDRDCEALRAEYSGDRAIVAHCEKYQWYLMISRNGKLLRYRKCCFDMKRIEREAKRAEENAKKGKKVR